MVDVGFGAQVLVTGTSDAVSKSRGVEMTRCRNLAVSKSRDAEKEVTGEGAQNVLYGNFMLCGSDDLGSA